MIRRCLFLLFVISAAFVSCVATTVSAASLYIDPAEVTAYRADTVTVAVRLDTDEGECVNTVDAVISYGGELLRAVDVTRGRSILSLWVEEPTINETARTITFAGGIPNGYCGRIAGDPSLTNILAELVFRVPGFSVGRPETNIAPITFEPETRVLLNDGLGTPAPLRLVDGAIRISTTTGPSVQDDWSQRITADTFPPEEFTVELTRDESVFSGKYYIVFSTTDKQSGIDHFEVIEESTEDMRLFRWGAADAPWSEVESPYVLKDQTLNSIVRVKAVDKAGNEYIAVLVPHEDLRTYTWLQYAAIGGGALILLLLIAGIGYVVWRQYRRRALLQEEIVAD